VKVNSPPVIIINMTHICSVFWLCATGWRCCSVRLRLSSLQTHYISKLRILLTSSKHNIAACEKPVRALYFWPSERCSQEEKCVCVCVCVSEQNQNPARLSNLSTPGFLSHLMLCSSYITHSSHKYTTCVSPITQ